jgi:hypothetical protein
MSFSRVTVLFALACLAFAPPARAQAGGDHDPRIAFVAGVFTTPPEPEVVPLQGETASTTTAILGQRYAHPSIPCWRAGGKSVWILESRVKSRYMTAGFVISEGRIEKSEVLLYREDRGRQIRSPDFLKQFTGMALEREGKLDRFIDGITGATISVTAMKNMARLALYLESIMPE